MKKAIGKGLLLFAVFMLVFAATAFADGNVCKIGDTGYSTFADAIGEVTEGQTITLTDNVTYAGGEWTESFTLEGGNHTITLEGDDAKQIKITAKVTARNVTFDLNNNKQNIRVDGNATVTMENVNVKNGGGAASGGGIIVAGVLDMKSGSIENCKAGSNGDAIFMGGKVGQVTLDGVKISGCGTARSEHGAIEINSAGETYLLTLKGKTEITTNNAEYGVKIFRNASSGDYGGKICLTVDESFSGTVEVYDARYYTSGVKFANIESGKTFTGTIRNMNTDTNLTGIADGDGVYWGTDGECYIGTDKYTRMSFADALAKGGEITLVKDVTYMIPNYNGANATTWKKNATINGEKHTITVDGTVKNDSGAAKPGIINIGEGTAEANVALNNVTLDFNSLGKMTIKKNAIVTLGKDVVVKNGYTTEDNGNWGGAFNVNGDATLNMTENSVICDSKCTSNGNAVFLSGTLNMSGTSEIKNCKNTSNYAAVEMVAATGVINLSESAKICDNTYGNVWRLYENAQINITDSFNGKVTFKDGARKQNDTTVNTTERNAAGKSFGTAKSGATVTAGAITCEADENLYAVVDGTNLIWTTDGEAYVGEDKYNRMTLADAVTKVENGGTISLVKDAEYVGGTWTKSLTLEGNNHTLTMKGKIGIDTDDVTVTFKNVTMTGFTGSWGVVAIGVGTVTTSSTTAKAVFDNCTITGNTIDDGGAITCMRGGTFELKDTTVTGNDVAKVGAVRVQEKGTIILSGSTTINNNTDRGTYHDAKWEENEKHVYGGTDLSIQNSECVLKIQGKLIGKIKYDAVYSSDTFGTAESGASLKNMETILRGDSKGVFQPGTKAAIIDGKLTWIAAPSLGDIQTDSGVYTEDSTTKAVIRAIGTVAAGNTGVEAVGIYVGSIGDGKAATWTNNPTESMNSKTFAADIYTSDLETERIVVEYMKIAGVDEWIIKSATVNVNKEKEIAKPEENYITESNNQGGAESDE